MGTRDKRGRRECLVIYAESREEDRKEACHYANSQLFTSARAKQEIVSVINLRFHKFPDKCKLHVGELCEVVEQHTDEVKEGELEP